MLAWWLSHNVAGSRPVAWQRIYWWIPTGQKLILGSELWAKCSWTKRMSSMFKNREREPEVIHILYGKEVRLGPEVAPLRLFQGPNQKLHIMELWRGKTIVKEQSPFPDSYCSSRVAWKSLNTILQTLKFRLNTQPNEAAEFYGETMDYTTSDYRWGESYV